MNWSAYNNREVAVILWSDGSRNVFYSSDVNMNDFVSYKEQRDQLTYRIERCQQSEYDVKYNTMTCQKDAK
jgi:hypothetical protein